MSDNDTKESRGLMHNIEVSIFFLVILLMGVYALNGLLHPRHRSRPEHKTQWLITNDGYMSGAVYTFGLRSDGVVVWRYTNTNSQFNVQVTN